MTLQIKLHLKMLEENKDRIWLNTDTLVNLVFKHLVIEACKYFNTDETLHLVARRIFGLMT